MIRKDFRKRITLLALTGALTAGLCACSNTASDGYDASSAASTEASSETESTDEASSETENTDGVSSEAESSDKASSTSESTDEASEGTAPDAADQAEDPSDEAPEEDSGTPLPVPEGQYLSELTGLPIDKDLEMQRPIAVMIDNEIKALPHYNTAGADIVYEMMNSTANDRITRLMCIYKDWENLPQTGSIRSVRPTNILVAQEYDAVICHDGGPFHINDYFSRYPYHFSGGMRQRVVMAIALAANPKILLADEPTTALDVTVQAQILDLLKEIQRKLHTATILVSHDLGVVARAADRVAIMYAGRIVEIGTAEEIYYDPRHPYTWGLMRSLPALARDGQLYTIPGMPPSLVNPPVGDAFACRNEYALAIDYREAPPMFRVSDTHYAATWLLDQRAPKVTPPIGGAAHG